MSFALWIAIAVVAFVVVVVVLWRPSRRQDTRMSPLAQAKRRFHAQRERLEAKFLQLASTRATPTALRWCDCTFADDVSYVRSRTTGELSAFVAVTIATEEADVSQQNVLESAETFQAGTAVFRFDRDHWETDGRAILNLSPSEAVQYYREQLEMVSEEFAHHS